MTKTSEPIDVILAKSYPNETSEAIDLRKRAGKIIQTQPEDNSSLPETLLELLSSIIKPLFTASRHPALTLTGRKNLVSKPPTIGHNFVSIDEETKPWKTAWTVDLLSYILTSYSYILPQSQMKTSLESHFHLLIPPILNMIDDGEAFYKASGCRLLRLLCELIIDCRSEILQRTGLTEVFIDALKPNFTLLPTLTPEDESLMVLQELYPAYRALVAARFIMLQISPLDSKANILTSYPATIATAKSTTRTSKNKTFSLPEPSELSHRQSLLTFLLCHALLHSLSHLGVGTSSATCIPLSTFMISQIRPLVTDMGVNASRHLQSILPLLRLVLCDPFGAAAPELQLASLDAMEALVQVCQVRVREKWWMECLRGLVGCWCVMLDEPEGEDRGPKIKEIESDDDLEPVKKKVKEVVKILEHVVGAQEFGDVKKQLLEEEEADLMELFAE